MSVVRLLVLGTIKRRKTAHGYSVYRDLTSWRIETWTTVRPGSIYHALSHLETQSLVKVVKNKNKQKPGPSSTVYSLTGSGEQEFINLLETAVKNIDIENLSAAIAFMEFLPRKRVIELLQERAKAQREVPKFLGTLPVEAAPNAPSKHPELIRLWSDHFADAATSTQKLITSIQSGSYVFKNDKELTNGSYKTQNNLT